MVEAQRIGGYHSLAVDCLNAVLALHCLRHMAGFRSGRAELIKLRDAVAKLPPLPLADDPFCRQEVIEVAGVQATSVHAAAFALAERTWNSVQRVVLRPSQSSRHRDERGIPYTRMTSELIREDPTEGRWSAQAWRDVCGRLAQSPAPDHEKLQAELALEWTHAQRRLRELTFRSNVADSEPQAGVRSRRKKEQRLRDRKREARDRWIHRECCDGIPYKEIIAELRAIAPDKGWSVVGTPQGIRWVAAQYAQRHDKPKPPSRR